MVSALVMATTVTTVSNNKTNFTRIGIIQQDTIPRLWQTILEKYVPRSDLETVYRTDFKAFRGKKTFYQHEETKIFSATRTGYGQFDISLLYKIFRNMISNKAFKKKPRHLPNFDPPQNGWDSPNGVTLNDFSLGADIERCKNLRNSMFHKGNADVSDVIMKENFNDFIQIAGRLQILFNLSDDFVAEISYYETCIIDKKTAEAVEKYWKEQIQRDKEMERRVDSLEGNGCLCIS